MNDRLNLQINLTGIHAKLVRKLAERGEVDPGKIAKRILLNELDKSIYQVVPVEE